MNNPPPLWIRRILEDPESIAAVAGGLYPRELLGCGHYGCVMSTDDPNVVIKITRDPTEAPVIKIIKELQERQDIQGFVRFFSITRLKDVSLFGTEWSIHVIVREAVTPWKNNHSFESVQLSEALGKYKEEADKWWLIAEEDSRQREALQQNLEQIVSRMQLIPYLFDIATGFEEWMDEGYPPFADVHMGNIGWNSEGHLVIFDPGHTRLAPPSIPEITEISPDSIGEVIADLDTEFRQQMEDEYRESEESEPYDEWLEEQAQNSNQALTLIEETASASFPLSWAFSLPPFPTTRTHLCWLKVLIDWFELLDRMGGDYSEMGGQPLHTLDEFSSIIAAGQGMEERETIDVMAPYHASLTDVNDLPTLRTYLRQLIELEEAGLLEDAVEDYQDYHNSPDTTLMGLAALTSQAYYSWESLLASRWRQKYFNLDY